MSSPAYDAKNVFIRSAPYAANGEIEVSTNVENQPTEQYEQVDFVWYFDDSHMVKLGLEVMRRGEKDRARTIAIISPDSFSVGLRLFVKVCRSAVTF